MLKYLIQTSIFRYSKNYGSLTHETRIKDAVNMGDLICLLANVRTLKTFFFLIFKIFLEFYGLKYIIYPTVTQHNFEGTSFHKLNIIAAFVGT